MTETELGVALGGTHRQGQPAVSWTARPPPSVDTTTSSSEALACRPVNGARHFASPPPDSRSLPDGVRAKQAAHHGL